MLGRIPVHRILYDYTVNVTSGAWVEIEDVMPADANKLEIFDSSGQVMRMAIGAAGAEAELQFYITPGGNGQISCPISEGQRVAIRAQGTTASAGIMIVNFYA